MQGALRRVLHALLRACVKTRPAKMKNEGGRFLMCTGTSRAGVDSSTLTRFTLPSVSTRSSACAPRVVSAQMLRAYCKTSVLYGQHNVKTSAMKNGKTKGLVGCFQGGDLSLLGVHQSIALFMMRPMLRGKARAPLSFLPLL